MSMITQKLANSGFGAGDLLNGFFAVSSYKQAREEGHNVFTSTTKAAGSMLWGEFYYSTLNRGIDKVLDNVSIGLTGKEMAMIPKIGANIAITMLPTLVGAGIQAYGTMAEQNTKKMEQAYAQRGKLGSGYFDMSEAGYTMRQRSLNAIRQNGLNTQSVFGNEARTYFTGVV